MKETEDLGPLRWTELLISVAVISLAYGLTFWLVKALTIKF